MLEFIGEGGMAKVYKPLQNTGQNCGNKRLKEEFSCDQGFVEKLKPRLFRGENQSSQYCKHL